MAATGEEPFYVGYAVSVYQNTGHDNTNWADFEKRKGWFGRSSIRGGHQCGQSTDFWNLYAQDIELAYSTGANSFRLSLEWSRIEPQPGETDMAAVQRYHDILDLLIKKGMTPFLTLHHFVHPSWFESLGGFEKEGNISYFVQYAQNAYRLFGSKVKYWTTFNEINVTSFAGFIYGSFPPGKPAHFVQCGRNMLNMLRSHTQAYDAIKAMPGGEKAQVGLVHNWFPFEPKQSCCTPFYVTMICNKLNYLWGSGIIFHYLQTGVFEWKPYWFLPSVTYTEPGGKPGCDYIGLNYYSRGVIDWKLSPSCNPGEVMTDMPYAIYPAGLRDAIEDVSVLGVPIYITETGVADKGDELRPVVIQTYFEQIEKAVEAGYDVRGVFYWSLVDNFEWAEGFFMKFGMFEWNDDGSQKRTRRKSVALLEQWFRQLPGRVAQHLERRRVAAAAEGKGDGADNAQQRRADLVAAS